VSSVITYCKFPSGILCRDVCKGLDSALSTTGEKSDDDLKKDRDSQGK
jgi:hypothetical protein